MKKYLSFGLFLAVAVTAVQVSAQTGYGRPKVTPDTTKPVKNRPLIARNSYAPITTAACYYPAVMPNTISTLPEPFVSIPPTQVALIQNRKFSA
jgi:hypothetical protein